MRIFAILTIFTLSACSVSNQTARHSGEGFGNLKEQPVDVETLPLKEGERDYRGELFKELETES